MFFNLGNAYWLLYAYGCYIPVKKVYSEKLQTLISSKQIILRSCPWYKWKSFSRAFQWCITSAKKPNLKNRRKGWRKKKSIPSTKSHPSIKVGWNKNSHRCSVDLFTIKLITNLRSLYIHSESLIGHLFIIWIVSMKWFWALTKFCHLRLSNTHH